MTQAKICGINSRDAVRESIDGGADFVGLVFYPRSPRAVTAIEAAQLVHGIPDHVSKVGLFVDLGDDMMTAILSQVSLDLLQLHGAETPARVQEIRQLTNIPVMSAKRPFALRLHWLNTWTLSIKEVGMMEMSRLKYML